MNKTDRISSEIKNRVKNELKGLIVSQGHSLNSIAKLISETYKRPESLQNLSQKLSRGSIKYVEVIELIEALGYKIEFKKI